MAKTMLITRVFPPQIGGNGQWMWELYSRLPCDQYVVVTNQVAGSADFDRTHNLQVVRLPFDLRSWGALGFRPALAYYRLYRRLSELMDEQKFTSIHASNFLPEGFLAWMLFRRFKLPYTVYVHGEELNIAATSRELSWMTRQVYRDAAQVICNSVNTANLLKSGWPVAPERVHVMHPGVDTQTFRPAPPDPNTRHQFGWHDRPVILTVGRLMKRKGHEQIIHVLPDIANSIPDVLYAIVGDGEERDALERLVVELALKKHVVFHGELNRRDLVSAFQQCDVFALPNRDHAGDIEGFGIVLLEAQACGKPVVAGDSGGTIEAMNSRSGRIIPNDQPGELVETLVGLLRHREQREQMGTAGREWVVRNFDWSGLAEQAAELFEGRSKPYGRPTQTSRTLVTSQ
jgi:phosphatidylinositol alpha-1,6-mannosyltransferase